MKKTEFDWTIPTDVDVSLHRRDFINIYDYSDQFIAEHELMKLSSDYNYRLVNINTDVDKQDP